MSTFTYHNDSKTVTCICGKEISGEHACYVIQVKECNGENCTICEKKKDEQLFIGQWYEDVVYGYSRCSTCGVKSDVELPKDCMCNAYVDRDGVKKCKSCNRLWPEKSMVFHECENCRFKGER